MNRKFQSIFTLALSTFLLSGCLSNDFKEEVRKAEQNKTQNNIKNDDSKEESKQKELESKPLDQVVKENELEKVAVIDVNKVIAKESYKDPSEFSMYAADVLYKFYTLQTSPEDYYKFMKKYGSDQKVKELPSKDDAVNVFSLLQEMYQERNIKGEGYSVTKVVFTRLKNEGHFYRKVKTTHGEEYFITTITREDGLWKLADDATSPPFEESKITNKESDGN